MYIKNGSTVFDAQQAIKELETLIQTNKYPEAYLELGKLYGKFNTTDKLRKSEEYFRLYSQCPGAKNIDNEKDELAVKRELRYNAFRQALIGKWRHEKDINAVDDNGNSKVIGGCMFDIEIYMDNEMNLKAKVVSHAKSNEFSILFWQEVDVVYDPDADAVRIHYSFMMHDDEEGWWGPNQSKLEIPVQEIENKFGVHWFYFTSKKVNYCRMTN